MKALFLVFGKAGNYNHDAYIVADGFQDAENIFSKQMKSWGYMGTIVVEIKLIAAEGQYAKPDILILAEATK